MINEKLTRESVIQGYYGGLYKTTTLYWSEALDTEELQKNLLRNYCIVVGTTTAASCILFSFSEMHLTLFILYEIF